MPFVHVISFSERSMYRLNPYEGIDSTIIIFGLLPATLMKPRVCSIIFMTCTAISQITPEWLQEVVPPQAWHTISLDFIEGLPQCFFSGVFGTFAVGDWFFGPYQIRCMIERGGDFIAQVPRWSL
ncbi:hypothetical protein ACJX0J_024056 [Zea mays]